MIKASAQLDLRELEKAMLKLKGAWKRRTFPQILNRSAGSIAIKSLNKTKHSIAAKIRDYFKTQVASRVKIYRSKKRFGEVKRVKKEAVYQVNQTAILTFLKHFPEFRKYREFGDQFYQEVLKFVNRAISSARYMQHGWKEAIDIYRKHIKGGIKGALPSGYRHRSGKSKLGEGVPAIEANANLVAEASLFNRTVIDHPTARPILEAALQSAVREETAQLYAAAERAIAADVKAVGG